MLVDLLLRELYVCTAMGFEVPKPYLLALCRTVAALDVFPVGEAEGQVRGAGQRREAQLEPGGQALCRTLIGAGCGRACHVCALRTLLPCAPPQACCLPPSCPLQEVTARRLLELARQLLTEVPDSSMRKDLKVRAGAGKGLDGRACSGLCKGRPVPMRLDSSGPPAG